MKRFGDAFDTNYDLEGMLNYLAKASDMSVSNVELARLAEEVDLRRKVLEDVEDWIHCRVIRIFAALIREQRTNLKGKFKPILAASACTCPECRCAFYLSGNGAGGESPGVRQELALQPSANGQPIVTGVKSREGRRRSLRLAVKARSNSRGKRR